MTEFEPPEKGMWISLRDHFPRALTPEYERLLSRGMALGEAGPFADYGMPIATLEVRVVHGHVYVGPKPLVGRYSDAQPPAPLIWLASRLAPPFRRRTRAAKRALVERPWLADAARWHATERGEWHGGSATLQAEDPEALDDGALAAHLQRAQAHADAGYERHFSLHGPDLIPTGLLIARCLEWDIPFEDVLPALAGASPASLGQGEALDRLRAAVAASGAEPSTVEELRAAAGPALDAFLAEHGSRLVTGYDLDSRSLGELPGLVVQLSRPVADRRASAETEDDGTAALQALRGRVPADVRAELDQLVGDARATIGMRDDNGPLTGAWPVGLLRRAMLAAGRRLAERGRLEQPGHGIEVTVDELIALLTAGGGPTAADVTARAVDRVRRSALVPPPQLGPDFDLPLGVLPAPMRRIAAAQLVLRDTFTAPVDGRRELDGDGIGTTAYQGRACVAADPADALARLEPGDVLVAMGTTPAYNLALSIVGAVVVEEGGLLSHAAVIARELGLPAVIGALGCMEAVPDGALVEVDPVAGQVRVLAPAVPSS